MKVTVHRSWFDTQAVYADCEATRFEQIDGISTELTSQHKIVLSIDPGLRARLNGKTRAEQRDIVTPYMLELLKSEVKAMRPTEIELMKGVTLSVPLEGEAPAPEPGTEPTPTTTTTTTTEAGTVGANTPIITKRTL